MTTKRKQSMATSRAGVNAVRAIVERANCLFQEVEQVNDIGNDAYIEFVLAQEATGSCIAAQVKSGPSFTSPDGTLVFIADRDHFEYWKSHVLPVAGIVFDPTAARLGWCDVTEHLRQHPEAVDGGPYRIPILGTQLLTTETFDAFREHFLAYQRQFSDDAHFGAALDRFAPFNDPHTRIEGLRSLFSYHRSRAATWCYVASLLRSIQDLDVLRRAAVALSHLPGHGDIYWHEQNNIEPAAKAGGTAFMKHTFGREDVIQLLRVVDEHGFARGTIGQAVHPLIGLARNTAAVLQSIAFDPVLDEDIRGAAIFLFVYYAQEESTETCVGVLEEFRRVFPDGSVDDVLVEMIRVLREQGEAHFY
jgi:hypothetical protein